MITVKPFRAYRPTPKLVHQVAALPYDVMNTEEAFAMAKNNPFSFLHVDRAEIDLADRSKPYDPSVYQQARFNLQKMIQDHVYIQDTNPCFYIYRLVMQERAQTGLVCCTAIDDYATGLIKVHEHTRFEKEMDRIEHIDKCNANTGPIFLTYRAKSDIYNIMENWVNLHPPVYDFTADDGITHTVWVLDCGETIKKIQSAFSQVKCLYIADGHHRSASAVKVGFKRRTLCPNYTGNEEFNYFLSVIFPDNELQILDYNRVVQDLYGHTEAEFLQLVAEQFKVEPVGVEPYKPKEKNTFGMYFNHQWYKLTTLSGVSNTDNLVENLDISILQKKLLQPILGIVDPRTDKRIDFIGGSRGLIELERQVENGMRVAFALYPVSVAELMAIADAGEIMPPKSTWFEPKLRSGIFLHMLE